MSRSGYVEAERVWLKAPLYPRSWGWICPCCNAGSSVDLSVNLDSDGRWRAQGRDMFQKCSECNARVQIVPVWIDWDGEVS